MQVLTIAITLLYYIGDVATLSVDPSPPTQSQYEPVIPKGTTVEALYDPGDSTPYVVFNGEVTSEPNEEGFITNHGFQLDARKWVRVWVKWVNPDIPKLAVPYKKYYSETALAEVPSTIY